jgi:Leucine-rich repeat (LRR) protein
LQTCTQLEYLDLSDNNIAVVEGLEALTKLNTLILSNNRIRKMGSLRPLSFNTSLQDLNLIGNEVTSLPNYSGALKHLISSLKYLDGEPLYFKDGNRSGGYTVRYDCRKNHEQASFHEALGSIDQRTFSDWNDISSRWDELDRPVTRRSVSSKKVRFCRSSHLIPHSRIGPAILSQWRRS